MAPDVERELVVFFIEAMYDVVCPVVAKDGIDSCPRQLVLSMLVFLATLPEALVSDETVVNETNGSHATARSDGSLDKPNGSLSEPNGS